MFYILIGLVSGVISGMGIGGGIILIPALTIFMGLEQHTAQGVNLVYYIPTAIIALIIHIKNKSVEKAPLPGLITGGIIGAAAGSLIALRLEPDILRRLFGGFLLIMGAVEFFKKEELSGGKSHTVSER